MSISLQVLPLMKEYFMYNTKLATSSTSTLSNMHANLLATSFINLVQLKTISFRSIFSTTSSSTTAITDVSHINNNLGESHSSCSSTTSSGVTNNDVGLRGVSASVDLELDTFSKEQFVTSTSLQLFGYISSKNSSISLGGVIRFVIDVYSLLCPLSTTLPVIEAVIAHSPKIRDLAGVYADNAGQLALR